MLWSTTAAGTISHTTRGLGRFLMNSASDAAPMAPSPASDFMAAGEVYVEISMLEGVGGVANLLAQVPLNRVLFGSHAPFFYFQAALLKLKESPLPEQQLQAIRRENARRLLAKNL